ncbi:MAG: FG-GAP-like repeat-containing protein [Desulfuromonadales bacterium]
MLRRTFRATGGFFLFIGVIICISVSAYAASPGIISTLAGNGTYYAVGNTYYYSPGDGGPATSASLYTPWGVALDSSGNIYIADRDYHRVRKVAAGTGIITTVAGNGSSYYSGDNVAATSASLFNPTGVAVDKFGKLYIADSGNHRIRKVDNGIITTVAGYTDSGVSLGFAGDGGPATSASLFTPIGVTVDKDGNLFIADSSNNRIRKVAAGSGIISTVAGGYPGFSGDGGPASLATLNYPTGVTLDSAGNLYIADMTNGRVRRIDAVSGVITTVAGGGTSYYSGDNVAATSVSLYPTGIAVDSSGNIYIADQNSNRIRKVAAASGIITTVAGNGLPYFTGDNVPATSTSIYGPSGVTIDSSGNLYIADTNNNRVRKVTVAIDPIVWRHQTDGKVYGMTTNGSSITGGAQFWQETDPAWSIVGQGDFDGDGIRDFVWWNSSTGQVYIMLMASSTAVKSSAGIYTESNTHWRIDATGDINGDGTTDLIWWNNSTGQVYAMLINGAVVSGGGMIYTESNTAWKIVAAADFTGAGKVELLWWNSSTGQVAIGRTNGTNASTATVIYTEPNTDWRIAGTGDLDDDGRAEIIWHNRTTGQVYGMQTNGTAVTGGAMIYTEANTQWEIVSVGNYNSDNKADLLWWNQQTGQVYLMPMNGLAVAAGGSLLYTEPDITWKIQGETAWRDNLYGRGVTTTTR